MDKVRSNPRSKKLIIMIIIVMLFNFAMPKTVNAGIITNWVAGKLLNIFTRLALLIPDALWGALQVALIGEDIESDETKMFDDELSLRGEYSIKLSPATIFSGKIPMFEINFINPTKKDNGKIGNTSLAYKLQKIIASMYKAFMEFALVGLLSVLVYIAIRMIASSASSEKAKYKKMLVGWFEAVCILFTLHFLMSMTFTVVQSITDALSAGIVSKDGVDELASGIRNDILAHAEDKDFGGAFVEIIIYDVLFIYTISFGVQYLKRVIYLAFLTLIAPLIALTYPLDKVKDGKAQAFEVWLKEFIFNVLLQPVHLIIYNLLIYNAKELVDVNKIYALVAIGSLLPAEKFIRKMFGLESRTSSGAMASALGGAAIMNAMNKIGHGPSHSAPHGAGGSGSGSGGGNTAGDTKVRTANSGVDPYSALRVGQEGENNVDEGSEDAGGTNPRTVDQVAETGGAQQEVKKPEVKNNPKTSTGKWRRTKGAWNVAKKYAPGIGKGILKGTVRIAGATTLGTVGLAAGLATGDMSKAVAGLAGGAMAGNKLGANLVDGGINAAKGVGNFGRGVRDTFNEGAYGKEEAEKKRNNKEVEKTEWYKKNIKTQEEKNKVKAIVNAGFTDTKKIEKAMGKSYGIDKAIAYMKMAEKCPNNVLYDEIRFKTFLTSYGIDEGLAEEIRKEVITFK